MTVIEKEEDDDASSHNGGTMFFILFQSNESHQWQCCFQLRPMFDGHSSAPRRFK